MTKFLHVVFATVFIFFIVADVNAAKLRVAVFTDHFTKINQVYRSKGCVNPSEIPLNDNQMLAEFLILCQAITHNSSFDIELVPFPVVNRVLEALQRNEIDAVGFGVWRGDALKHGLSLSKPLIQRGEFQKGLYTRKSIATKFDGDTISNMSERIVVLNQNWLQDWNALGCSKMRLKHVDRYEQMFKLVEMGRADFLPLTFSNKPDLQRKVFGVALYPLRGIKIKFPQSLHYAVNPENTRSGVILRSLDKGVSAFRQSGALSQVYRELGLINNDVKDWKDIGC